MLNKRGQITVFLIIGIILLLAAGLIFFLRSQSTIGEEEIEKIIETPLSTAPIKFYVETCIEDTTKKAVNYTGQQGGYYNLENITSTNYSLYNTSYYFYVDENIMPTKEKVQQEIADYIDDYLLICLDDFKVFEEQGFDIKLEESNTSVLLNPDQVNVFTNMPLNIKKGSQQTRFDDFFVNLQNIRLGSMLDVASVLIDEQVSDPDYICLSCIYEEAEKNDLYIDIESEEDSNTYFFTIIDNSTKPVQELIFANEYREYSCDNPPPDDTSFFIECMIQTIVESGYRFYLEDTPNMNATVNETFYYEINASGSNLTFSDYTYLFDIDEKNGVINFTPTIEQIGTHVIWVKVTDKPGNEDFDTFQLNITNSTGQDEE